jgi:DNA-directed RNA polymerase subunit RPC12/RpoP
VGLPVNGSAEIDASSQAPIALGVRCPGCGSTISLTDLEPSVRCQHCQSSHLVVRRGSVTLVALPDRIRDSSDALLAASEAVLEAAGTGSTWPPTAGKCRHTPFFAPSWLFTLRLHEAVIGHGRGGDLEAEAWSAPLHIVRPASEAGLRLPDAGRLPDLNGAFLTTESLGPVASLPLTSGPESIEEEIPRLEAVRLAPSVDPLVRDARIARGPVHLLLRPFHLLQPADGPGNAVLLDGASRSLVAILTSSDSGRLLEAIQVRVLPETGTVAFRAMRCPVCSSRLALSERGEIRFCPGCRRALEVNGERLVPVPYRAEIPGRPRRLLLPFWRFRFCLSDPRDGKSLTTVGRVVEAAGGATAHSAPPAPSSPLLDVPAFRSEGRRRQIPGLARLPGPFEHPASELVEGPVRGEAGFPEPARFAAISPGGAALVARHVLLLAIPQNVLTRAAPRRMAELLFRSDLRLEPPELVVRALRSDALAP